MLILLTTLVLKTTCKNNYIKFVNLISFVASPKTHELSYKFYEIFKPY